MTQPVQPGGRRATYEDLLRAPSDKIAEIVDGELVLAPRPSLRHSMVASLISGDIGDQFHRGGGGPRGPGGWWILIEPELHLGPDILVPDVGGWRREKMTAPPDGAFSTQAPGWICEVLSPSTAGRDRVTKMRIYAREGVQHVWLVDPASRTVEVFRLQGERWVLSNTVFGSAPARLEPFEAAELDLSRWWGETPDPPQEP